MVEKKPTWWLLYILGGALVAVVALLEVSVTYWPARLVLELAGVVVVSALMLVWLYFNRGRIELTEARPSRTTVIQLNGTADASRARKNPVKIAAEVRRFH
jgi:hypothetical protein